VTALAGFGRFLRERQPWVLIALLAVLHLTLLAGPDTLVSLMCWLVDVGLFLLWQPFVQAERKLDSGALALVVLVLAGGAWLFGGWLLILWVTVLAALLGGRVMLLGHRPTRIFYLLAFAYLLCALLVWLVPRVVPDTALSGPSLDQQFAWTAPLIFVAMLAMPRPLEIRLPSGGMVDFFYSLFIFLLIAVLVLGSLTFMLLRQSLYIEAVFKTLVSMAGMLLLIAWAWNPRPGFSGIGVFLSRYLLTIGLPFETWLQRLMECAERESDPDRFLYQAFEGMLELPWVAGGAWFPASGAQAGSGRFGQVSRFRQDFPNQALVLTLYTRHKLSPALVWHFHLLSQLTNEYYVTKQRARELQQMGYLRAVHETGARLTHDIKNLLQSLSNLCFLAQAPDDSDGERLNLLVQRQLPQITQRLQQTLEKLQTPQAGPGGVAQEVPAEGWWQALQQRYAHDEILFSPVVFAEATRLPAALFDSVADNLLHNALQKRQGESGLIVRVALAADAQRLSVCDGGSALRADIVDVLLHAPVPSDTGFGIGLYHAASQAEAYGYELRLTSNVAGEVCFELKAK
jgi:signal transduction histidine kinase